MDYKDSVRELSSALKKHVPENPPFGDEMAALKVDTKKVPGNIYKLGSRKPVASAAG